MSRAVELGLALSSMLSRLELTRLSLSCCIVRAVSVLIVQVGRWVCRRVLQSALMGLAVSGPGGGYW